MAHGVFGIIAPHPPIFVEKVGGDRALVARASLDALEAAGAALAGYRPDAIVLMSPHAPGVYDTFLADTSEELSGSMTEFGDDTVYTWPGDPELAAALIDRIDAADIPIASRDADERLRAGWLDHATIVPLSFLEPTQSVPLVVLSLSYLSYATHRALGDIVREVADDLGRRIVFVASGDLSHRLTPDAPAGFDPRASQLDEHIVDAVSHGTLGALVSIDPELVELGGECGLRSIITLGGFAGEDPSPTRVLAYEGPWGVGYLTAMVGEEALVPPRSSTASSAVTQTPDRGLKGGMPGHDESEIVSLARTAIESCVSEGVTLTPIPLTGAEYPARGGAFVSLHRYGQLRGCIGTIAPTQPTLALEVAHNAVQASLHDPRFAPLRAEELADLEVKVDVLKAPEPCTISDLDPSTYGVIVTSGTRRGLLLPDLDGVDDVAEQVAIAMRKAGIAPGESCDLERFLVNRYV